MSYFHGPPFDDGVGLLRFLRGNMRRGKDNMVVSEGPEGSGKSTTTATLCREMTPDFSMVDDTIMSLDHLLDVLEEGKQGRVYDLDEAINIFHNQDWATWEAKALTKLIRQMRIMRCTWFLNVPDFDGLHPYIRDYRARIRLYHEPVFDEDGMGNQPSRVLWKKERFDYREQSVSHRWSHLFDLEVDSLDDDPEHKAYEDKKVENFRAQVQAIRKRRKAEQDREHAAMMRQAKRAKKKGQAKKKADKKTPPTTT